jgi:hypothetical protein
LNGLPVSELTELEVLDCLRTALGAAAADCDRLARGVRGPVYRRLRDNLRRVEGSCRQITYFREDTRWLYFAVRIPEVQRRVQKWLVEKQPSAKFKQLAEVLRKTEYEAQKLAIQATGRIGMILPRVQHPREHVARLFSSNSGIILPSGFTRKVG